MIFACHHIDPKRPVINSSDEPKAIESMDQNPIAMTVGNNVTALTKTSVTIQCNASGIPPPVVTWTKDGQKISSGDKYSIHDNGSLFIREPDESGAAQYTCTAENDFGKVSASSSVQIVGKFSVLLGSFVILQRNFSSLKGSWSSAHYAEIRYSTIGEHLSPTNVWILRRWLALYKRT